MDVKPNLKKFKIVAFRGYDIGEVDDYIDVKNADYESTTREQKSRITELLEENRVLKSENERVSKIEKNLSLALLHANEKSDQIITQARQLADAEIKRVRIFRAKWEYFAKEMLGTLSPKQQLYFERMSSRIDQTLTQFSDNTDNMKKVAATSSENIFNKQTARVNAPTADSDIIDISEVYKSKDSLADLMSDIDS
ncbi:MAG: DivIVA domain-containing protein [Eubacteriales bacterium]|nr:DivIVA domain-containing protein [Clostridia bacterium]MDD4422905.1 DivIVA domain-containing protein [Eubacteriales bacterium]